MDLVVRRLTSSMLYLLGNGDGTFGRAQSVGSPPNGSTTGHAVGDMDGDGDLDIIITIGGQVEGSVGVFLNRGISADGWEGFESKVQLFPFPSVVPQGIISAADFDEDGYLDVAVADNTDVIVLLNQGLSEGGWNGLAEVDRYAPGDFPDSVITGDLDDDGDLDLVVGNYFGGDVSVLLGNGDGTFLPTENFPVGHRTSSVNLFDLDGDGDLDIAAAVFAEKAVSVLMGNGDGTFAERVHYETLEAVDELFVGDIDNDSDLDIAVLPHVPLHGTSLRMQLFVNDGQGAFTGHSDTLWTELEATSGIAADFNGDGAQDLAVTTSSLSAGSVDVFLNTLELESDPLPGDANGDGAVDFADFLLVSANFGGANATREDGDFNADGEVTFEDFLILSDNFGRKLSDEEAA